MSVAEYETPAPDEGAGEEGAYLTVATSSWPWPWEREISKLNGLACDYGARRALVCAELIHEMDCEDRGLDWASALQERCDDPFVLLRFLPIGTVASVRREAERLLLLRSLPGDLSPSKALRREAEGAVRAW